MITVSFSRFVVFRSVSASLIAAVFGAWALLTLTGFVAAASDQKLLPGMVGAFLLMAFGVFFLVRFNVLRPDYTYFTVDQNGRGFSRPWIKRHELDWGGPVDIRYAKGALLFNRPPIVGKLPVDRKGRTRHVLHRPCIIDYNGRRTDGRNRGGIIPAA
jgi:hypothetical protein